MRFTESFIVLILLVGWLAAAQIEQSGLSYYINFGMQGDKVIVSQWKIIEGDSPRYSLERQDGYILSALRQDGGEIYAIHFDLFAQIAYAAPPDFFDENSTQIKFEDNVTRSSKPQLISGIIVPYHPDAVKIRISDPDGKVMMEIDVSKYAHLDKSAIGQTDVTPPPDLTEAFYGRLIVLAAAGALIGASYLLVSHLRKQAGKKEPKTLKREV